MTTKDDLAVLQQTMPTGVEGLKALDKFVREGNAEVKKLLYDECDILLECRYCRNIFRSVINYVSHKRSYCRASHVAVVHATSSAVAEEDGRAESATKRRTGQMSTLTRRLETHLVPIGDTREMLTLSTLPRIMKELPLTTFEDGMQKVIGSLPSNLAQKVSIPPDRVTLTMPQDYSSKYKEMLLRSRKAQNMDKESHRDFTSAEIKIIENFEKQDVRCGDYVLLQCDHPSCKNIRPFHTLHALAYHCSLRHTKAVVTEAGEERWACLLCSRHMWSLDGVNTHLMRVHPQVKEAHLRKRLEEERSGKGGKKRRFLSRRSRSLSMVSGEEEEEEVEEEEEEEEESEEEDKNTLIRRARGSIRDGCTKASWRKPPRSRRPVTRSPTNSDDYGEPPVLLPQDEDARDEDDDDEEYKAPRRREKSGRRRMEKESISPSETEKLIEEIKQEIEDDEEDWQEKKEKDTYGENTVESCMAALIDRVCAEVPDPVGSSPVDETRRATPSDGKKTKRQYIKKADRERMEEERRRSEMPDLSRPSSSRASAGDDSRPQRHRKRPRWMVDEVIVESAKKGQDGNERSLAEESEEEEPPKEIDMANRKKKIESKVEKVDKTVMATPAKRGRETKKGPAVTPQEKEPVAGTIDERDTLLFTPRAGKAVIERRAATTAESEAGSSRKRKQNLGKLADDSEDIMIVSMGDTNNGTKKSDLTAVPVYLSEHQQAIFFAGLILQTNTENGSGAGRKDHYECMYCQAKLPNIRDGRRHMVAHLRVMRLRCGLCGAGSFFCIDMRNHLQLRGCPELAKAPAHMLRPGTPCMTKEHADELTFVAHAASPGRALFTSGKIVSILSNKPYLPDPVIEEKILGPTRVPPRHVSPRKPAHKLAALSASTLKETGKGTVSLAAVQRSTTAPAAVVPHEDDTVQYYEDAGDPQQAARDAEAAAAAAEAHRRATMPPANPAALRQIGEPMNARRPARALSEYAAPPAFVPEPPPPAPQPQQQPLARRVLSFAPAETPLLAAPLSPSSLESSGTSGSSASPEAPPVVAQQRDVQAAAMTMTTPQNWSPRASSHNESPEVNAAARTRSESE